MCVLQYFSPQVILHKEQLDYNKYCLVPFGAYVKASHETDTTYTDEPRTIDAIYLRANNNMQGGHELLDLKSKRVITRRKVVEIPVTRLVIQAVEQMAKDDGIKELKYTSKYGVEETNDWLAGVNDNDTNSENDQTESDQNEDESSNNDEKHSEITGVDRQDYNEEKKQSNH